MRSKCTVVIKLAIRLQILIEIALTEVSAMFKFYSLSESIT
jgi:hypothetical protein